MPVSAPCQHGGIHTRAPCTAQDAELGRLMNAREPCSERSAPRSPSLPVQCQGEGKHPLRRSSTDQLSLREGFVAVIPACVLAKAPRQRPLATGCNFHEVCGTCTDLVVEKSLCSEPARPRWERISFPFGRPKLQKAARSNVAPRGNTGQSWEQRCVAGCGMREQRLAWPSGSLQVPAGLAWGWALAERLLCGLPVSLLFCRDGEGCHGALMLPQELAFRSVY